MGRVIRGSGSRTDATSQSTHAWLTRTRQLCSSVILIWCLSILGLRNPLANPTGGHVVIPGSATIRQSGAARLEVLQHHDKAIIDWRSFSIGSGEHTHFSQPSSSSVALNRVNGPDVSAINGQLTANGGIFLVNPNGILFGPGAEVNVGNLVATTADISNKNFLAGRYQFDRPSENLSASVVNQGRITVAEVASPCSPRRSFAMKVSYTPVWDRWRWPG